MEKKQEMANPKIAAVPKKAPKKNVLRLKKRKKVFAKNIDSQSSTLLNMLYFQDLYSTKALVEYSESK